ncbi:MAG: hypothetical protein CL676_05400 [Bdellovibrionaceae bacterium]|nr:hypothetical protein [Pseudobdellovibrionaceae bacterium]|tara:strand:- start:750 stop:1013 length:264 start_codon:yes stop_codon:yes gene_type:complete
MSNESQDFQPQFSTLVLSLASSSIMALGLEPHPHTQKVEKDLKMAQFNIDLLNVLKTKTQNNLTTDEKHLLESVISDLQIKFCEVSK